MAPDGIYVLGMGRGERAIGIGQIGTGVRQAGFRKGHVGPGDLTHLEPVLQRPQFLAQQPDVVLADADRLFLQQHAEIGGDRTEQDLLLDLDQRLPRGQHGFLRRLLAQPRRTAVIDQLRQVEAGKERVGCGCGRGQRIAAARVAGL